MPARKKARPMAEEASDSEESWRDEDSDMAGFGEETHHLLDRDSDGPDEVETFSQSGGRLRLRPDIALEHGEYSGQKTNRKDAFDESDQDEDYHEVDYISHGFEGEDDDEDGRAEMHDEEFEAVNREYEELQKEEQEMLSTLRGQNDSDVRKGRAVKHQKELWDKALDTRIALQKIITSANRLPQDVELSSDSTQLQETYNMLSSAILQNLSGLLDLQNALVERNPGIVEEGEEVEEGQMAAPIDNVDSAWERLSSSYSRLVPFRDRALDRWHRKTQISSGAAASRAKLKAFNQSISQQVATAMKDPTRFIARLLTSRTEQSQTTNTGVTEEKKEGDVFDDSEFYQQLLREFLETSNPNAIGALSHEAVKKLRTKKRKAVDRRASKGRKIRYTVHEPLVNFMVPESISLPPMTDKLFSSLFGSKLTGQEAAA